MDNALYDYSPLPARRKLTWPNGARIAFYIGLNIEHYEVDKPSTSIFGGTAGWFPIRSISAGATTACVSVSGA